MSQKPSFCLCKLVWDGFLSPEPGESGGGQYGARGQGLRQDWGSERSKRKRKGSRREEAWSMALVRQVGACSGFLRLRESWPLRKDTHCRKAHLLSWRMLTSFLKIGMPVSIHNQVPSTAPSGPSLADQKDPSEMSLVMMLNLSLGVR